MKGGKHPLLLAYSNVFTRSAPKTSMILTLEDLASAYRQRATDLDPDTRLARGETPAEVAARIASVRNAYRLIRDVMVDQTKVWVTAPQSDVAPTRFVHVRGVDAPNVSVETSEPRPAGLAQGPWTVKPAPLPSASSSKTPIAAKTAPRHVATLRPEEPSSDEKERIFKDLMAPPRPLLGRYLVQEGMISLSDLIRAVQWQRQQRPPVGRIAIDWGIMTWQDVVEVLKQKEAKVPFCSFSVKNGAMKPVQRIAVLTRQRQMQKPIGQFFVEQGILTERDLNSAIDRARAANV